MNQTKASRYHRLKRRSATLSVALSGLLLAGLVGSGASTVLRDVTVSMTDGTFSRVSAVAIYVSLLMLVREASALPLTYYHGFLLERRYGLSTASFRSWAGDYLKTVLVGLVIGLAGAEIVFFALRHWPEWWWLVSAATFMAGLALLSAIAPVVMLPLFYSFIPLHRDSLRTRLVALCARAGVPVLDIYQWGLGEKTRRANAALVGTGRTRRILLSDTLLEEYSDDEIEVVIAHELAHHVHHDIPKALLVEFGVLVVAFYACARALETPWLTIGLSSTDDVAGLPVLLLAGGAFSLAGTPLRNALSRRNERSADRYAMESTGQPAAFISAMRRLAAQNLAEERPSRAALWFFYTHPPVEERIAAARAIADTRSAALECRVRSASANV